MDRLKGKTAMVVGAGSIGPGWGNGKATAVSFAREGAQVFCVDRNAAAAKAVAASSGLRSRCLAGWSCAADAGRFSAFEGPRAARARPADCALLRR